MKNGRSGRLAVCLCFVAVGLVFPVLRERTCSAGVGRGAIGSATAAMGFFVLRAGSRGPGALPLITAALGVALLLGRVQVAALAPWWWASDAAVVRGQAGGGPCSTATPRSPAGGPPGGRPCTACSGR